MLTTTRLAFRDARRSIFRFRATSLAAAGILGRILLVRTSEPVTAVVLRIQAALASLTPGNLTPVKVDVVEDQFRLLTASSVDPLTTLCTE
jgi:hypothetical protein